MNLPIFYRTCNCKSLKSVHFLLRLYHVYISSVNVVPPLLDRNASTGMAMWTVAEILDSCSSTEGRSRIITSCISRVQILSELVQVLAHFDTSPNSKHFIISICLMHKQTHFIQTEETLLYCRYNQTLLSQIQRRNQINLRYIQVPAVSWY